MAPTWSRCRLSLYQISSLVGRNGGGGACIAESQRLRLAWGRLPMPALSHGIGRSWSTKTVSDALSLRSLHRKWILHRAVSIPTAYSRGNNLNHLFGTELSRHNQDKRLWSCSICSRPCDDMPVYYVVSQKSSITYQQQPVKRLGCASDLSWRRAG